MRRHLRLRRLLHYATTMAPPRAPATSCAATSSSATSTALRRPRLLYARHLRPWLLQLGYLDISTKGYHPHELLSSRNIRIAPTLQLRGDVSPSVPTFGFSS